MRQFTKINESFICENCGFAVPPATKTCRNHCPRCLHSKHVDVNPGDRAADCLGLLTPIGYEFHSKKGLMIQFSCSRCDFKGRNIALLEENVEPDNYEEILKLKPKLPR